MFEILSRLRFLVLALLLFAPKGTLNSQTTSKTVRLLVDATAAPQKILHAHMQMPVEAGSLTLYYPKWIPGEHMPDGPIINVAGLKFRASGMLLPWRRDLDDPFAFHLEIPQAIRSLEIDLDFLLSAPASGFSAGASATAYLDVLSWNQVLLYPKGYKAHDLTYIPSLKLPPGWKFGTALPGPRQNGDTIEFDPVPLDMLVDSPVIAGRYFRAVQLTPGATPLHEMDIVADSQAALAMTPETEMHFHQLVAEAGTLFGSRHYRDYHFLLTLSDDVAHFGLEHHESSDDRTSGNSLTNEDGRIGFADLLPHEFVHSWNGKYRRPADLATSDYEQPMKDDLLWVYEGLTEYLGEVLTARSGLRTEELSREQLALVAGTYQNRPGRDWRPLQDTADSAIFLYEAGGGWSNWRRGVDFYDEGQLLWLDVDATIRRLSKDRNSLDDFCKGFHGGPGGEPALRTYTFEDVVAGLNQVVAFDWSGFLRKRLDATSTNTPLESVQDAGWKLVYNERPNTYQQTFESMRKRLDLIFSLGMIVETDGAIADVNHESPSFKAGIGPGMKITAIDGHRFTPEGLKDAIDRAKSTTEPIDLLIANGAEVRSYSVEYHGGLRYPHLERNSSDPDYLGEILRPQAH